MRTIDIIRHAGVSRRALRLYEEKGLIAPPRGRDNDYRVFDRGAVQRIHTIRLLQTIGFSLDEIARLIRGSEVDWVHTLEVQERLLAGQQAALSEALAKVRHTLANLRAGKVEPEGATLDLIAAANAKEDLKTMQDDLMSYYNERAKQKLASHPATQEEIRAGEKAWADIAGEIQGFIRAKKDPASPEAQALLPRMDKLISAFTMNDPDVTAGVTAMWKDPAMRQKMASMPMPAGQPPNPFTAEVMEYMGSIRAAARK